MYSDLAEALARVLDSTYPQPKPGGGGWTKGTGGKRRARLKATYIVLADVLSDDVEFDATGFLADCGVFDV